jgi:hypothetical protein
VLKDSVLVQQFDGKVWSKLGLLTLKNVPEFNNLDISMTSDAQGSMAVAVTAARDAKFVPTLFTRDAKTKTWVSARADKNVTWLRVVSMGNVGRAVWTADKQIFIGDTKLTTTTSKPPTTATSSTSNQADKNFLGYWSDGFSLEWTITQNGKIYELEIPGITKIPVQIEKSLLLGNLDFGMFDDYNLRGSILCQLISKVLLQCAIGNKQPINMTRQPNTQLTRLPRVPSPIEFKHSLVNQKLITKRGEYMLYFEIFDENQIKSFRLMPNINVNHNYGTMQVGAEIILNNSVQQVRGIVSMRYSVRGDTWNLVEFRSIEDSGGKFAMEFELLDSEQLNDLVPFTKWVLQAFDFGIAKGYSYNITSFSRTEKERIWNCKDGFQVYNKTGEIIAAIPKAGQNITTCQYYKENFGYSEIEATDKFGRIYNCNHSDGCNIKESTLGNIFGDYQDADNPINHLTIYSGLFQLQDYISLSGESSERIVIKGLTYDKNTQREIYLNQFCKANFQCRGFYLEPLAILFDHESDSFELYDESANEWSYYTKINKKPDSMRIKISDSDKVNEFQPGETKKFQVKIWGVPTNEVTLSASVVDEKIKGLSLTFSEIHRLESTLEITMPKTVEVGTYAIKVVAKLGEVYRETILNIAVLPEITQTVPISSELSMGGANFRIFKKNDRSYYVAEDPRTNLFIQKLEHKGTDATGALKLEFTIINLGYADGLLEIYDADGVLIKLHQVKHTELSNGITQGTIDLIDNTISSFSALWEGITKGDVVSYIGDFLLNKRYQQPVITVIIPKGGKVVLTKTSRAAKSWNTISALYKTLVAVGKLPNMFKSEPLLETLVAMLKDTSYDQFFWSIMGTFEGDLGVLLTKSELKDISIEAIVRAIQNHFEEIYSTLNETLKDQEKEIIQKASKAILDEMFTQWLRRTNPALEAVFTGVSNANALLTGLLWGQETALMDQLSSQIRGDDLTDKSEMILFNN